MIIDPICLVSSTNLGSNAFSLCYYLAFMRTPAKTEEPKAFHQ